MGNPDRCAEAVVPDDISFETRPQQVIDMIDSAIEAKAPFAWCAADEEFGQNPGLCDHLHAAGISYVMAAPKNTTLIDTAGKEIKLQHLAPRLDHTTWHSVVGPLFDLAEHVGGDPGQGLQVSAATGPACSGVCRVVGMTARLGDRWALRRGLCRRLRVGVDGQVAGRLRRSTGVRTT